MIERLHFLVVYVGSAAMVAFLAVCASSPRVAIFTCDTNGPDAAQRCELLETLATVAPASGDSSGAMVLPDTPDPAPVVLAAAR